MGELVYEGVFPIDKTIGQEEYLHPQFTGDHILFYIIAYHEALLGFEAVGSQDLSVIVQVGLTESRIFIGILT